MANWWNSFWLFLEELVGGEKYLQDTAIPTQPSVQPTIIPISNMNLLNTFCEGIKFREGANPRNNNPGNCKYYYGGYLPMYGHVTRSPGGFAMFPTYAQGWLYLQNTVRQYIRNHPNWTIQDFFNHYAPSTDGNDPVSYAAQVAQRCGVPISFPISGLLA